MLAARITDRYGDSIDLSDIEKDGTLYLTAIEGATGKRIEIELDDDDRKALRKALKKP